MALNAGVGGINRTINTLRAGVGGVNKTLSSLKCEVGGIKRELLGQKPLITTIFMGPPSYYAGSAAISHVYPPIRINFSGIAENDGYGGISFFIDFNFKFPEKLPEDSIITFDVYNYGANGYEGATGGCYYTFGGYTWWQNGTRSFEVPVSKGEYGFTQRYEYSSWWEIVGGNANLNGSYLEISNYMVAGTSSELIPFYM